MSDGRNTRDFALVTGAYWAFTLTDGALRMMVLLHLHDLGYRPLELAMLFVGYEVFGVVTNLVGGWLGTRVGLKALLFGGLALQLVALGALAGPDAWIAVPFVIAMQALSGVAKDLVKTSAKSWTKLVVPENESGRLMRWVALLTGSKNALKGVGFFVGAYLLAQLGFRGAMLALAGLILVALVGGVTLLPSAAGRSATRVPFRGVLSRDARINWLSAARVFLFGSRDAWFVVALPVFLAAELDWNHAWVGAFLAIWVIGYGILQANSPRWVDARQDARHAPGAGRVTAWTALCGVPLVGIALGLSSSADPATVLVIGLTAFAVVFATTSSVHSFLIVAYAEGDKVSLRVGFYYMANALGRLVGTVMSGAIYQGFGGGRDGLVACLIAASGMIALSTTACLPLRRAEVARAA